ncbi:hypothetical protein BTHERMOSOX_819 [Bathymodiolus thermophilus thioautotrophic gill symbiont]|nr:hypothetical protein BTHERMOSOX_819 [Bathymodiolus thermophilus thioautotrophic gill symbiont]
MIVSAGALEVMVDLLRTMLVGAVSSMSLTVKLKILLKL